MWFKKTRMAYLALLLVILTLFATGAVAASAGQFNPIIDKMPWRIDKAVDSGELTQEQVDARHQRMKGLIAEGGKKFDKKGGWKD